MNRYDDDDDDHELGTFRSRFLLLFGPNRRVHCVSPHVANFLAHRTVRYSMQREFPVEKRTFLLKVKYPHL